MRANKDRFLQTRIAFGARKKSAFQSAKALAFTLMELLVVIAIIAILPSLACAKERACRIACLNNLKTFEI